MMAGFGRERHPKGTLSPLRAQALALEDRTGNIALLVTADVLGFGRVSVDALRHKLKAAHGIPPEAIIFAASHTHWGPAINHRTNMAIGSVDIWYLGRLEETILKLAAEALANRSAAEIVYGACDVQIGMNRRRPDAGGVIQWGVNPEGGYDKHTPVLSITRHDSPRRLVLIGHACHPTSMGPIEKWSPGYPGAMREKVEASLKDCRALFVMGCGSDAKVVYQDTDRGEYVFANAPAQSRAGGIKLADAVLRYLETGNLVPLSGGFRASLGRGALSLQTGRDRKKIEEMAFDGDPRDYVTWWARQMLAYPNDIDSQRYEVQAWRLGTLTLVALEGEVVSDLGPLTRSLTSKESAMVIGYANSCPGYIATAQIIRQGGYEGDTSHLAYFLPAPFDPKAEQELVELVQQAVEGLVR